MLLDTVHDEFAGFLPSERARVTLSDQVARFYEETRGDVYRYLLTVGLHPPQAQEAAQEVFLRLYVTLKKGEFIENQRAWVFRVAHNLGLKVRARQDREPPYDPEIEVRLVDPELNPEQSLLARERAQRFHQAIEGLSDQQRRCLYLRLEGLRYTEVGAVLGISPSAVGEFLRRAVVRLKKVTHA